MRTKEEIINDIVKCGFCFEYIDKGDYKFVDNWHNGRFLAITITKNSIKYWCNFEYCGFSFDKKLLQLIIELMEVLENDS